MIVAAQLAATASYGLPKGRRYPDVPMLLDWNEKDPGSGIISFSLPAPIWRLLAVQRRYAYLELGALARMRTRYGVHLYRRLALRMSSERWSLDETPLRVELTPDEAAAWIGYEAQPIVASRLTTTLKRAVRDMKSVGRFAVDWLDPVIGSGRGAPVVRYALNITMRPPGRHEVKPVVVDRKIVKVIGGMDVPEYQVSDVVWRKLETLARRQHLYALYAKAPEAWFVALQEALTGTPVTDDFAKREYRGHALMEAIRKHGANEAAFHWGVEELRNPDLICLREAVGPDQAQDLLRIAKSARFERVNDRRYGPDRKKRRRPERRTREIREAHIRSHERRRTEERRQRWPSANVIFLNIPKSDSLKDEISRLRRHPWSGDTVRMLKIAYSGGMEGDVYTVGGFPASLDDIEALLIGENGPRWHAYYLEHPSFPPATPLSAIETKAVEFTQQPDEEPAEEAPDWELDYALEHIEAPDMFDFVEDAEIVDDIPF